MLVATGINKRYGALDVLKDVSLTVHDSEIISIVGPSGAGKTTLLQILGTLEKPDSGIIVFNDTVTAHLKDHELSSFRNKKIGFVFQSHQLLPEFTLLENVMMPALISGMKSREARKKAMALIDEVGLSERVGHKPSQLSGGESQRGAVARALMNDPELLLADEPTGSLDSANRDELQSLFFQMRDKHGCMIIMVTHDPQLANRCDRIIELVDGKIKA